MYSNAAEIRVHSTSTSSGRTTYYDPNKTNGRHFIHTFELRGDKFSGSSKVNLPVVSAQTGVKSAGTVIATVTDNLGKRDVMGQVLDKARSGGRSLGKGAARFGSVVARQSPWGRAFWIALAALDASKYFWSDEKGDFVREKDDDMYVIVATDKNSSSLGTYGEVDDKTLKQICERANVECTVIDYVKGANAAHERAKSYCKSKSFTTDFGETLNFDDYGWSGFCTKDNFYMSSTYAVKIFKYVDYVPMTLDEFIDEATPEADSNPNDWVETSGVQPTDEPKVEVPAGTVAQTNPYTDPKDGKVKQTRWDFEPNGKVRETEIPRPDLTPDSPEAPRLDPPQDDTGTDTGDKDKEKDKDGEAEKDKDKDKSDTQDLCEKNPDVLACDKQPEKPNEEKFPEIPTEEVKLKFKPDSVFPNAGQCPAPVSFQAMGGTYEISTQPICDIAVKMRPFVIAMAYLAAAFFVIRTIKSETS